MAINGKWKPNSRKDDLLDFSNGFRVFGIVHHFSWKTHQTSKVGIIPSTSFFDAKQRRIWNFDTDGITHFPWSTQKVPLKFREGKQHVEWMGNRISYYPSQKVRESGWFICCNQLSRSALKVAKLKSDLICELNRYKGKTEIQGRVNHNNLILSSSLSSSSLAGSNSIA